MVQCDLNVYLGKNGFDIRSKRFSTSEEGDPDFQILRLLKEEKRKLGEEIIFALSS